MGKKVSWSSYARKKHHKNIKDLKYGIKKADYLINEHISKGVKQQFVMLLLFILLVIFAFGAIAVVVNATSDIGDGIWKSFIHLLDPGTVSGNGFDNIPLLVLMVVVTLIGMVFTGLLISIINNALENKLTDLRRGVTQIIEKHHIIVFGFNNNTYTILKEQIEANKNLSRRDRNSIAPVIVVVDDVDKEEMETKIASRINDFFNTKIICRRGVLTNAAFYPTISLEKSKAIIICCEEDDMTLKAALTIGNYLRGRENCPTVVAQVYDEEVKSATETALVGIESKILCCEDVISRITAQVCRQPGLSYVLYDLFNYEEEEIYIESKTASGQKINFDGKLFPDVMNSFSNSTIIGVSRGEEIIIKPKSDFRMAKGDYMIHIAVDDNMIELKDTPCSEDYLSMSSQLRPHIPQRMVLLVFDWNQKLPSILTNLDSFVAPDSEVIIFSHTEWPDVKEVDGQLKNFAIKTEISDELENPQFLKKILDDYEDVTNMLFLCDDTQTCSDVDMNTMIRLLHFRNLVTGKEIEDRIIFTTELKNPENQRLMEVAKVNDFIVGSEFTSRLITQVANQPDLEEVFNVILTAEGAEIYLRKADDYIKTELQREVSFADLTKICYSRGDIAIGWMIEDENVEDENNKSKNKKMKAKLNPLKTDKHKFKPGEQIIVLSEGYDQ